MPKNRKLDAEAPILDGGLKAPTAKPEPLVGEDRKTKAPVERAERIARESDKDSTRVDSEKAAPSSEGHGSQAVVDLAVDRAVEADEAAPKDERTSAEAVDQGSHVRPVDVERAELDAASHAEQLGRIEDEVGSDALGLGVRAAGDRQGDHVHNVDKAAHAAADAEGNVASGRSFSSVEERGRVDSPHGRVAEAHDAWQAARWAPHGDLNVPAVSYGPEDSGAIYGELNPQALDQLRGLEGDSKQDVADAKREAGPGVSIARERLEENQDAKRIGRESL